MPRRSDESQPLRNGMFIRAIQRRMEERGIPSVNDLWLRVKDKGVTRSNLYYFFDGKRAMRSDHLEAIFKSLDLGIATVYPTRR